MSYLDLIKTLILIEIHYYKIAITYFSYYLNIDYLRLVIYRLKKKNHQYY
jgi:hypothetical protein